MKCFVTIFNLHSWPKAMLPELVRFGLEPVLIDNHSTFQPCIDWLESCEFEVVRLERNYGPKAFWDCGLRAKETGRHIVTDSDLDLSLIPSDIVERMEFILDSNPDFHAVGPSLEIDDIPDSYPLKDNVLSAERRFWNEKREGCFVAQIDTTFAMYEPSRTGHFFEALRLDRPYTARHLPWYLDIDNPSDEMKYYLDRVTNYCFWSNAHKKRSKS